MSYLSAVLAEAVDDELIPANPAAKVSKAIARQRKEDIDPFSAGELDQLLKTVETPNQDHYSLFLLLARTGVRVGEALALQWGDVDFNGRFIEVKRSRAKGRVSTRKSGKSRKVDMSPELTDSLKRHLVECKKKGFALGLGDSPELVFTNEAGGPIDVDNWRRRVFNKALSKAELRKIRIHDLRHTCASLRIAAVHNIET